MCRPLTRENIDDFWIDHDSYTCLKPNGKKGGIVLFLFSSKYRLISRKNIGRRSNKIFDATSWIHMNRTTLVSMLALFERQSCTDTKSPSLAAGTSSAVAFAWVTHVTRKQSEGQNKSVYDARGTKHATLHSIKTPYNPYNTYHDSCCDHFVHPNACLRWSAMLCEELGLFVSGPKELQYVTNAVVWSVFMGMRGSCQLRNERISRPGKHGSAGSEWGPQEARV